MNTLNNAGYCLLFAKTNSLLLYFQQIPGDELANIFKESLESRMFSKILETLALECGNDEEASSVLSYLQGFTSVRRFSTLALFLSPTDKSSECFRLLIKIDSLITRCRV